MGNTQNPLMMTNFNLLRNCGFIRRRIHEHVSLKNISYEDEEYLFDIKNWYIDGLWTEGYTI